MNSKLVLVSALAAGVITSAAMAQTATPQAPAAPAPSTSAPAAAPAAPTIPAPHAVPAKIALIEFEEVTAATNEGQKVVADIEKKYEPQRTKLEGMKAEIDSLTKQLQGAPATMGDEEKATRARTIDTKQKQLQRDADDYSTQANTDVQDALGKVAQKIGPVLIKYVQDNGYSMLLDNTGRPQQGGLSVLWAPGTDISEAVVEAYNKASGVAAPAPSAPSAVRPRPAAPKPAAPKQ